MSYDMGTLLAAVRDRLKNQVTDFQNRVTVVADEELLPLEAAFPACTVRDGGTELASIDTDSIYAAHTIVTTIYVQHLGPVEAPVLGLAGAAGIAELTGDVLTALKDNTLTGVSSLYARIRPQAIGGTELVMDAEVGQPLVRKSIAWLYRQKPSV